MGYVTLAFLLLAALAGMRRYKNWYNPVTLFFGYWACLIFLALLHLYNFYALHTNTFILFFIGLLSVFLGFYLTGKNKIVIMRQVRHMPQRRTYNYRIFLICNILLSAFLLIRVAALLQMIASGRSWWSIRLIASGNDQGEHFLSFWGSNFMYNIYTYIAAPIIYMEAPMFVVMLYNSKYRNRRLLILMAINFVLFSVMTVSRNLMSFMVVYFIVGFFIFNKNNEPGVKKSLKKIRKFIPAIIVVLIGGICGISALRNTEEDIFETLYIYMIGGLPSIEYRIEHFTYPVYTLGLYTLRGFVRPILFLAHIVGMDNPVRYQTVIQIAKDCEMYIPIGTDVRMNAYATIFYSLYRDGGYIGIVIGSAAFGWIMKKSYDSLRLKNDLRSYIIYFLIVQQIFFSMARFYFVFPTRAFSYVWALLLLVHPEEENTELIESRTLNEFSKA